jgi:hypothetical protein
MAVTATKLFATPLSIKYLVTSDVVGPSTLTIANATVLADMVAGPLKTIWSKTYANQADARTALINALNVRVTYANRDMPGPPTVDVNAANAPATLIVGAILGAAGPTAAVLEIEYKPQLVGSQGVV